jgi:hypothetical protein
MSPGEEVEREVESKCKELGIAIRPRHIHAAQAKGAAEQAAREKAARENPAQERTPHTF